MKSLKYIASFTAVAFVLCAAAFAKNANSGNFELTQHARVGSTVLQPGHYKAEWTGSQAVQISIVQNGKTVATTQGTVKALPRRSADAVTLETLQDKTQRVDEIDFSRHSEALVLSGM